MSLTSYRAAPPRGNWSRFGRVGGYLAIAGRNGKPAGGANSSYYWLCHAVMALERRMNRTPLRKPDSGAGEGLRTASGEVLDEARRQIDDRDVPDAMAVHEFRKGMKRWRALLRLFKPQAGQEAVPLAAAGRGSCGCPCACRGGRSVGSRSASWRAGSRSRATPARGTTAWRTSARSRSRP